MASDETPTLTIVPAEVRNQIYGYLLKEDDPIQIAITKSGVLGRRGNYFARKKGNRGRTLDSTTGQWIPATPIKSAVISVNRQIYVEAVAVLYGSNRFNFHYMHDVEKIAAVLGERARLFCSTSVDTGSCSRQTASKAFRALTGAHGLRTIGVSHDDVCPNHRIGNGTHRSEQILSLIVYASTTLLRRLNTSYQQQNVSTDILDVVRLQVSQEKQDRTSKVFQDRLTGYDNEDCPRCGHNFLITNMSREHIRKCGCRCSNIEHNNAELQRKLSAMFASALGIQDTGVDK